MADKQQLVARVSALQHENDQLVELVGHLHEALDTQVELQVRTCNPLLCAVPCAYFQCLAHTSSALRIPHAITPGPCTYLMPSLVSGCSRYQQADIIVTARLAVGVVCAATYEPCLHTCIGTAS